MILRIEKFKCSQCGAEFYSRSMANNHNYQCDKCQTCKHAYYVYGCEFACDCKVDCGGYPKYSLYERNIEKV